MPGDEIGKTKASWPAVEAVINEICLDPNVLSELRQVLSTVSDRGEPLREFRDLLMRAADARQADANRIARPGEKIAAPFQATSLALVVAFIGFLALDRIRPEDAMPWIVGAGFLAILSTWFRYQQALRSDQVSREAKRLEAMIDLVKEFEPTAP